MKFSRISVTKKGVELAYERKDEHKSEEVVAKSAERPLPSFADALQSFTAFVIDLLEIPDEWRDNLTVTTLNLSEDKNGYRGLIVTATRPIPKAYDRPLVMNTPLVREGSEDASDEACTLSDEVLELVALVEGEAVRYLNGEREQLDLLKPPSDSENVREFDENAAHAEVQSTRKPKGRKGKTPPQSETGVAIVANEPGDPVTDAALRQLLLSVEQDVGVDAIGILTSSERSACETWARETLDAIVRGTARPEVPEILKRMTTPALSDGWTSDTLPPKASDVLTISGRAKAGVR
jgi:hypothetical protein